MQFESKVFLFQELINVTKNWILLSVILAAHCISAVVFFEKENYTIEILLKI
ncbi:hypothetical protein UF75_1596 [Desulfosporosinus sp. I2]|nr:hypothetical protein UF75_1596 [Desulfosporosinus sp. I2]